MPEPQSLARLIAVDEIKTLRAQYQRALDRKQWDDFAELLTDDIVILSRHLPGVETREIRGRTAVREAMEHLVWPTVHYAGLPIIEITTPCSARGTWAYFFTTLNAGNAQEFYGHYEDEYVKVHGVWRFRRICTVPLGQSARS